MQERHDHDHDHDDRSGTGAVRMETEGVRQRTVTDDAGMAEARRRFGGFDLGATLAGMLAALGLTVLLAGLAGAAGSIGYQRGADAGDLSIGGLLAGLAVLLLSFLVGGWVAGRIARYNGLRNGIVSALWFLFLAAALGGLGAWAGDRYDFFNDVRLPQWFSDTDATDVLSALAGIAVMLGAAALGGILGARYHQRADALIAQRRDGATVRGDSPGARIDTSDTVRRRVTH